MRHVTLKMLIHQWSIRLVELPLGAVDIDAALEPSCYRLDVEEGAPFGWASFHLHH